MERVQVLEPVPEPRPRVTRELLDRVWGDLSVLAASDEGRRSKRVHNAIVDALKQLDRIPVVS